MCIHGSYEPRVEQGRGIFSNFKNWIVAHQRVEHLHQIRNDKEHPAQVKWRESYALHCSELENLPHGSFM